MPIASYYDPEKTGYRYIAYDLLVDYDLVDIVIFLSCGYVLTHHAELPTIVLPLVGYAAMVATRLVVTLLFWLALIAYGACQARL